MLLQNNFIGPGMVHCYSLGAEGGMSRNERGSMHMQGDCQPFTQAGEATTATEDTSVSRHIPSGQPETIGPGHSNRFHQRRDVPSNTTVVVAQESNGDNLGHTVSSHSATHESDPAIAAIESVRDTVRQQSEERLALMAKIEKKEEKIRDLEERNSKIMFQLEEKEKQITNLTNELHQMKEKLENEKLECKRFENELREKERKISELEQTIHQKSENNFSKFSKHWKRKREKNVN